MKWFIGVVGIVSIVVCFIIAAECAVDFVKGIADILRKKGA